MVVETIAGLGAIKTAFDLAKGLKDIDDAVRRNAVIIELQEKILSAQQAQSTLVEAVSELEKEVARLKNWETDKARYELAELAPGAVALALKKSMNNGEPLHHICANCAANGKKSYVQQQVRNSHLDRYKCNTCGEELTIHKDRSSPMPFSGGRGGPNSWMGR